MRRDQAYTELKRRLLLGEFPAGARLVEKHLATALGVSRTPIREALLLLTAEGLLDCHPRDGFWPCVPDLEGLRELYEMRVSLELRAIERPDWWSSKHDAGRLEGLLTQWRALVRVPPAPGAAFVVLDEEFHLELAQSAGNVALAAFLQMVHERLRLVRIHDPLTPERVLAAAEEHVAIVEALVADDVPAASAALRSHLVERMPLFLDRAARALGRMAAPGWALQA